MNSLRRFRDTKKLEKSENNSVPEDKNDQIDVGRYCFVHDVGFQNLSLYIIPFGIIFHAMKQMVQSSFNISFPLF